MKPGLVNKEVHHGEIKNEVMKASDVGIQKA
jgi:hypothetical protein